MLPQLPPPRVFEETPVTAEVPEGPFAVVRDKSIYVVEGPAMQRLIDSVNFGDEDSLNWFHRTMRKVGIIDALRKMGANEGSTVRMENMEFDFVE